MKKRAATKKSAKRPAAKKPVAARRPAKAPAATSGRDDSGKHAARYTPASIQGTGWAPFRYPPQ